MWTDDYRKYADLLHAASTKQLSEQMQRLERDSPELSAVINFLALSLADHVEKSDRDEFEEEGDILDMIPPPAINFALTTPLVLPARDVLCDKLNKWAARVWFEKLRQGILEEPSHFCGD
ncbi:hypothetical protein [Ferruginivarius sediminum]|uniref:Uncharacterized protein n=1 Tax=Ferruginivarius sediminum TaxID=2661937 RepID=A0A369TBC5_9PROT|nr:hypothetical protein [Ferruginivarius sediminum]RDD61814.1 hypothetical protein DRB17_11550 [Ferruginivarius sediminum]